MPQKESEGKEESQGRYLSVLMATIEKGTYNFEYVPFLMIRAFGWLLYLKHIIPQQSRVYQFRFVASRKGTEQVQPVVCAFTYGNADPSCFFFLLVHNGIFLCVWFVVWD